MTIEFVPFPKIGRLKRNCVIAEKIDGANAGIQIMPWHDDMMANSVTALSDGFALIAQSRSRIVTPGDDNFGFVQWVSDNAGCLGALANPTTPTAAQCRHWKWRHDQPRPQLHHMRRYSAYALTAQ